MSGGLRLVSADGVPAQPWKNGGGVTRDLLRRPVSAGQTGDDAAWALRISLADIAADGPFSAFPGIARHFAVLSGRGVRLAFAGRAPVDCRAGDPPLAFDGADAPGCALLDGATRDLNVMVDRRLGCATLALARAGAPWRAQATARGVFVGAPARLARAGREDVALPARTLAWLDDAREDDGAWTLLAADPSPPTEPPGWFWITFTAYEGGQAPA